MAPPGPMRKGEARRLAGRGGKSNPEEGRRTEGGGRRSKTKTNGTLFLFFPPPSVLRPPPFFPLPSFFPALYNPPLSAPHESCGRWPPVRGEHPFFRYASPRRRDGPVAREGRGREGCISFMVNRNLLRQFDLSEQDLQQEMIAALHDKASGATLDLENVYRDERQSFEVNKLLTGRVANIVGDDVVVDIGYKSEGIIPLQEWYDEGEDKVKAPHVGDEIQVLLDAVEDESGAIVLSYRKAKRQAEWEAVISKHKEGDVVSGMVTRKIKGGLLVNIGVNVFLPASQVDIRRPPDIADYIGKTIDCMILKIDEARRNIVVSRRRMLEVQRETMKKNLLSEISEGQIRKGVVKNIAEFGAFVDLGGIDGLLHITDMSWGRIANPHEVVHIDQQLEVFILSVDKDKEKIALGLKQKTPSPWANVEAKYPVNSRHTGEVVNVMSYGAFVKLEAGIEGLVHISEMSWTKRINHPSELVSIGDQIEVQVLNINQDKQEISLGIKQLQPD